VVLVTLVLVAAATSWGMLLAAYARTPAQAGSVGSAVALIFAGVSGNFVPRQSLPDSIRTISYISPNSWGLEAYSTLTSGGGLRDVVTPIMALATMTLVLFLASALAFRRQYA